MARIASTRWAGAPSQAGSRRAAEADGAEAEGEGDGDQGRGAEEVGAGANHRELRRRSAVESADDDRGLAFGDHPLGACLAVDDDRVARVLDAASGGAVFSC